MTAANDTTPEEAQGNSPWMCHICNTTSRGGGITCSVCFRTTCSAHLRRRSVFNRESGLYEITSVCADCIAEEILA